MKNIKNMLFFIFLYAVSIFGATIKGTITDGATGVLLPGANVMVGGTSLGSASDIEGRFTIQKIPPGNYTLKVTYIGYEVAEYNVQIKTANQTVMQNAELVMSYIEGDVVVVSAQSVGQLAAINQQLAADAMMNIVDAERIQELPDQNVAEAIARVPGITISRVDGEGASIRIRGLNSQYNQVQIDGVVMGGTGTPGRADDFSGKQSRSVTLQGISQENLSGIEVYKAILPDMDAATLGGTVNMRLGRAPEENEYDIRVYGGYNAYEEDLNQYKIVGKMSRRFFDKKLGVQFGINAEQRNRGSDRLIGSIQREEPYIDGVRVTQYRTTGATISNTRAIRTKQGIDAIFDYSNKGTEILFSNFFNSGGLTSRMITRNASSLSGYKTESDVYMLSNALRGTHNFSKFDIEWRVSHFRSETDTPDDYQIRFNLSPTDQGEIDALNAANKLTITPEDYLDLLPNTGIWNFNEVYKDEGHIEEVKYAEKFDIKYPFFYKNMSGFIKTGVLFKQVERSSRIQQRSLYDGLFPNGASGPVWSEYTTDYNPDPVLNGKVSINHYIDVDKIKSVWTDWIKDYEYAAYKPLKTDNENYDMTENYYAGYLMMKLNAFNDVLTVIPGIRYEGDDFDATGYYHYIKNKSTVTFNGVYEPRSAKREHEFWLPMVHIKVKPLEWLDTRFAYTETISRPNFRHLIPYVTASFDNEAITERGNPDLKTATSKNFDLSTSIYSNRFGLFTIAGYYKEIKNFSYTLQYYVGSNEDAIMYGLDEDDPAFDANHYINKNISFPVNTHGLSTVKGIEVDYQANLSALPGLLKNFTFGINYTRAFSNSWLRHYEVTLDSITYISQAPWIVEHMTYDIGFRKGRLPTQPDHILNMSIGYDIGGFSGRFSTFFQGRSLSGVGRIETADTYVEDFVRYDMSLRYKINEKLSLLFTGVNLTSTPDITSLSGTDKHSTYSVYGAMYDFGVQYSF